MSNLLNAADILEREANRVRELMAAAEHIRSLGSLEQAENDLKGRVKQLQDTVANERQNLAEVLRLNKEACQSQDAESSKASARRAELRRDAEEYAETVKRTAEQSAERMHAEARQAVKAAEERTEKLRAEQGAIVSAAKTQLAGVQQQLAESRRDLAEIEERTARAKTAAKLVMEGV